MGLSDPWTGPERMSRCYACCQENCGYGPCSCECHRAAFLSEVRAEKAAKARAFPKHLQAKLDKLLAHTKCKKHRAYKAIRKPRSNCEACWRFYIRSNP